MTEERIVNRTPETFGQRLEKERLEADGPSQTETPRSVSDLDPGSEVIGPLTPVSLRSGIPEPEFDDVVIEEAPDTSHYPMAELISEALKLKQRYDSGELQHAPRDPDLRAFLERFEKFEKGVISSFKHMGVDTKKFFGV